ncbi:hypothetical protein pdam_00020430, partial [Pocillopora damicornis]
FNILILKRFIKEMVTMQQEKDKYSAQIRLGVKACGFLIFLIHCLRNSEIKARLRGRIQAIFPAMDDGTSTKRTTVVPPEVNEDSTAIDAPRKIKVKPLSDSKRI